MKVKYPDTKPQFKKIDGQEQIFCIIRKKWLLLTPEEWVRQNFLLFLIHELQFSSALIAVEKQIAVNDVKKRFDIVVYSNEMQPYVLIECKEMNVPLDEKAFLQALHYNSRVQSRFLVVTNGSQTFAFEKKGNDLVEVDQIQ